MLLAPRLRSQVILATGLFSASHDTRATAEVFRGLPLPRSLYRFLGVFLCREAFILAEPRLASPTARLRHLRAAVPNAECDYLLSDGTSSPDYAMQFFPRAEPQRLSERNMNVSCLTTNESLIRC